MKIRRKHIRHFPHYAHLHMHKLLARGYQKKARKYANLSKHSEEIVSRLYSRHEHAQAFGNASFQQLLERNTRFKNIHKGKRCFVLGNGPSLRDQNLSLLADEITFTVNKIARLDGFEAIKSNYHLWADPRFFQPYSGEEVFADNIETMKRVSLFRKDIECFVPIEYQSNVVQMGLDKTLKMNYFYASPADMPPVLTDFGKAISEVQTVVHAAIYLAIYMGFSEIYLLGCEMTGVISFINTLLGEDIQAHAIPISESERKSLANIKDTYNCEDSFRGFYNMFKNYRIIGEHCKKNGIYLCNCTDGGILDVLPREKYEEVIQR